MPNGLGTPSVFRLESKGLLKQKCALQFLQAGNKNNFMFQAITVNTIFSLSKIVAQIQTK